MKLSHALFALLFLLFVACGKEDTKSATPESPEREFPEVPEVPKEDESEEQIPNGMNYAKSAVKVSGDNVYIGNKYDERHDLQIHFKKSMFNELMTFSSIGLVKNSAEMPSRAFSGTYNTVINRTTSDNIGPVAINAGAYTTWAGGNHSYQEAGKLKTAYTESYVVYADGKELKSGDAMYADQVKIVVVNKIYDFSKKSTNNGEVVGFSGTICTETVEYLVQSGNIEVTLKHDWENASSILITRYYGMQSMTNGKYIFFPRGHTSDFVEKINGVSQNKSNYPKFNRIVQKGENNAWYESCYLTSDGIGNHENIGANDFMYLVDYGKAYHQQLKDYQVNRGTSYFWRGVYSYFKPLVDNDKLLAYIIKDSKGTLLIVDVKAKGEYFVDLEKINPSAIKLQDSDLGIGVSFDEIKKGVTVSAESAGSSYIKLE